MSVQVIVRRAAEVNRNAHRLSQSFQRVSRGRGSWNAAERRKVDVLREGIGADERVEQKSLAAGLD